MESRRDQKGTDGKTSLNFSSQTYKSCETVKLGGKVYDRQTVQETPTRDGEEPSLERRHPKLTSDGRETTTENTHVEPKDTQVIGSTLKSEQTLIPGMTQTKYTNLSFLLLLRRSSKTVTKIPKCVDGISFVYKLR